MADAPKIQTAPVNLPVSRDDMKDALKVDLTDEDTYLDLLIRAASDACEQFTGLTLINTTFDWWLDQWPPSYRSPDWEGVRVGAIGELYANAKSIELPRTPCSSITHIVTLDETDLESAAGTTFAATNYQVDTASRPSRLAIRNGKTPPNPDRTMNGIRIRFVAGFGANPADVPAAIRIGIAQLVGHMMENREAVVMGSVQKVPLSVQTLWDSYVVKPL